MEYNNDSNSNDPRMTIINKWFNGPTWANICKMADDGSQDCLELMEHVNQMLGSLIFHLQNESGDQRIQYEIKQFNDLLRQFNDE